MTPGPYMDLLARNLRAARAAAGLSQADVAERMTQLGFTYWRRQTVARAEKAERRLTSDEVIGLMVALETDMTALLNPPAEFQAVLLPAGQEILLPAAKYTYDPDRASVWRGNVCLL